MMNPAAPGAPPMPAASPGRRQPRALDIEECAAFVRERRWGVLATSTDEQPYAVPVAYGWDGESLFVAMNDGLKAQNIERNPRLCFTIADATGIDSGWRSVVAIGRGEWVVDLAGRLYAFDVLRRQQRRALVADPRNAVKLARARLLRIRIHEFTGRTVEPYPREEAKC
jgi:nitroimidazol reductase NimA-like FMN-containing flavoprotein (pyridoxamine 5'-phosphate oxidase superfamily)